MPSQRPTTASLSDRGRWSSRRKTEVVLRALRGEDLDTLSRELGVTAATISSWRDQFLAGGQTSLKTREADEEIYCCGPRSVSQQAMGSNCWTSAPVVRRGATIRHAEVEAEAAAT